MARIRTIKPEILEDERTACLSGEAFKLFIGMIVLADDHGNLRATEKWLDGQVFWGNAPSRSFAEILRELSLAGLVGLYECRGQVYAAIRSWSKHQRIDNASKPRVPMPNDQESSWIDADPAVSPQSAETRGETRLDPDPDPDPEGDHDRDARATAPQVTEPSRPNFRKPRPRDPQGHLDAHTEPEVLWAFERWVQVFDLAEDTAQSPARMAALKARFDETRTAKRDWRADVEVVLQAGRVDDFVSRQCAGELERMFAKRESFERFRRGPPKPKPTGGNPQPGGSLADCGGYDVG